MIRYSVWPGGQAAAARRGRARRRRRRPRAGDRRRPMAEIARLEKVIADADEALAVAEPQAAAEPANAL